MPEDVLDDAARLAIAGEALLSVLRDLGPSREISIAITQVEGGLLWAQDGLRRKATDAP